MGGQGGGTPPAMGGGYAPAEAKEGGHVSAQSDQRTQLRQRCAEETRTLWEGVGGHRATVVSSRVATADKVNMCERLKLSTKFK